MDTSQSDRDFYLPILGFVLGVRGHILTVGNDYGLTVIQTIALILLDDKKQLPMKSICPHLYCDASNVTGIISGLENKGLVKRASGTRDRRVKIIQLTPEGLKLQRTLLRRLSSDTEHLAASSTEDEILGFSRVIEKLAALRVERQ